MSCQIRLTANIQDISAIRRCLFPTDDQRGSDNWLQLCKVSASPTGDVIAIANERKIVVLSSKWDSESSLTHYQISYSGSIHEYDKVKAVLCLPIVGQSQSTHVGPDWTCILIGYDSGFVRFYTENCELLLEEQMHSENITSVKCQSQHSPRPDISPDLHPEEIYIQYQSNICVLNGQQLFSNLRNRRAELAKVQAKGHVLDLDRINFNPKKWGFQDQAVINDCAVVGLNLSSAFDHLLTASICGGFDTKYRSMPPNNTLVVAAGSKPFLGYHYALEGGAQPVLSDVAKAMATKLKSALPGWLTGNKTTSEKQMSVSMQPSEAMGCRFGLCDLRRTATDIILSPDRKHAAICDALGRVLLIDTFKGITLRIFKGYRDAQCSFIQVPDERKSKHRVGNKVAHFLVIYSPKKGTVEIFSAQQGSKITTFTASRFSRLLYISYGLMGFTTTSKSRYICQLTTIFIDNDGQVKEILIPFYYALEEKNNKRARDIHLYKKLRHLIKSGDFDEEMLFIEVQSTCSELKTTEIKLQLVEMLLGNKDVSAKIALSCVEYFNKNPDSEDNEFLRTLCVNVILVLKLYLFVTSEQKPNENLQETPKNLKDEKNGKDDNRNESTDENSVESLKILKISVWEEKELKNLEKLLVLCTVNNNNKLSQLHVRFSDTETYSVSEFLSAFDLTKSENISLSINLDESLYFKTSEVLFKPYINGDLVNYEDLQQQITQCKITIKDLFDLLINYWVNKSFNDHSCLEKEMRNLSTLIYLLVKTAGDEVRLTEYSEVSKFWSKIRIILADSSRPFPALMAAIQCKSVAHRIENEPQMDDLPLSLEYENIEVLSQENVQWSILISKLEDISLLNIVLSNKPTFKEPLLPQLSHEKTYVSLKSVLEKGKGSVSELVAQWLTSGGVDPKIIVLNDIFTKKEIENKKIDSDDFQNEPAVKNFNLLKKQFPYSLETSNLLSNMAWEYALAWRKDIKNLGYLEAAVKCSEVVQNTQIKQGLYQLLWNAHIKIVLESACKLINKVGKLPKERLCLQDTGLSDHQISLFIGMSTDFLDSFIEIAQHSFHPSQTTLQFENIWENGGQPLVELAAQQKEVNYDMLHLHYQLSLVLQMITTFSVKHSKPVNNLFEASLANLLFTDLQSKLQVNWNKSDIKINSSRTQFLCKIISASLEGVTVNEEGKIYSAEHVAWMSKCVVIARYWNLDVDYLRRFQIVQLYSNGYDKLAEELIPAVNEPSELGILLLNITGKRLAQFLSASQDLGENISALSPYVTKFIDGLEDWCAPSPLKDITVLATYTVRCLNENQSEYRLAQLILEACSTLEEIQS